VHRRCPVACVKSCRDDGAGCARGDAIDGIAKPEVDGARASGAVSSPRSVRFQMPEGDARPMLQAAKRAGVAALRLVSTTPDRRAAIDSVLSAGSTGHGADDRGHIRQGALVRCG
jgi:hypothetical protein